MIRTSVRTIAVAAVAAASCFASAVPAVADLTKVHDGAGDVWEARMDLTTGDFTIEHTDVQRNVDVRNVKIAHSARKLKFWVRYVEAIKNDDLLAVDFMLNTPERSMLSMSMSFDRRTDSLLLRRNGKQVKCSGLRAEVQFPQDEFELDIPRSCLGRPEWVKVGGVTSKVNFGAIEESMETGTEPESISSYGDLIGNRGFKRLTWTERLYRG